MKLHIKLQKYTTHNICEKHPQNKYDKEKPKIIFISINMCWFRVFFFLLLYFQRMCLADDNFSLICSLICRVMFVSVLARFIHIFVRFMFCFIFRYMLHVRDTCPNE